MFMMNHASSSGLRITILVLCVQSHCHCCRRRTQRHNSSFLFLGFSLFWIVIQLITHSSQKGKIFDPCIFFTTSGTNDYNLAMLILCTNSNLVTFSSLHFLFLILISVFSFITFDDFASQLKEFKWEEHRIYRV